MNNQSIEFTCIFNNLNHINLLLRNENRIGKKLEFYYNK